MDKLADFSIYGFVSIWIIKAIKLVNKTRSEINIKTKINIKKCDNMYFILKWSRCIIKTKEDFR